MPTVFWDRRGNGTVPIRLHSHTCRFGTVVVFFLKAIVVPVFFLRRKTTLDVVDSLAVADHLFPVRGHTK